jgi:hypothetical protein
MMQHMRVSSREQRRSHRLLAPVVLRGQFAKTRHELGDLRNLRANSGTHLAMTTFQAASLLSSIDVLPQSSFNFFQGWEITLRHMPNTLIHLGCRLVTRGWLASVIC